MIKVAHYWYDCGAEIQVFISGNRIIATDKDGLMPRSPITGAREHPLDRELSDFSTVPGYEEFGLYYRYSMTSNGFTDVD